ncbi:hypothetical protein EDD11_007624, partial [Mortierella claussenii]
TLSFIISVELTRAERQQRQRQQQQVGQGNGVGEKNESGDGDGDEEEEEEQADYMSPLWHGGKVLIDTEQEGVKVNKIALFPLWVLPRLKELELHGMPAMQFDFRSLQSMKRLEGLTMSMDKETLRAFPVRKYMDLQTKTWKRHWQEHEEGQGQGERQEQLLGDVHGQKESVDRRDQLLQMWALPELKDLTMEGAPATMFWLDWLTVCPELDDVRIRMWSDVNLPPISMTRMPFFFSGDTHKSICRPNGSKDVQCDRNDKDDDEAPLLNSQLSWFRLRGTWRMTPQDVTRLLTVYAPFLQGLHVDRVCFGGDEQKTGYQFLKAIMDADHINQTYADRWHLAQQHPVGELGQGQQGQQMPGSALITVVSEQPGISEQDKKLLKLSTLTRDQANVLYDGDLHYRRKRTNESVRVYSMMNQCLVREQDLQAAVEMVRSKAAEIC